MAVSQTRTVRVLLLTGTALLVAAFGVSLYALQQRQQPQVASPFSQLAAAPAYIVVSTSTPVLFTAKVADRQLKKRSVVLVRLDASGRPFDFIGRLHDDGKLGDVRANDDIYSLRTTLNETAVGSVSFAIAAWLKPGTWREPEPDDDDWDKDFGELDRYSWRDRPARLQHLAPLIRRLTRYVVSTPVTITIDPFKLPPDPGEAGKATLRGIDSDGDGVRDDLQRFIGLSQQADVNKRKALLQLDRLEELFLVAPSNRTTLISIDEQRRRSRDCMEYFFGPSAARDAAKTLQTEMLNTSQRSLAYGNASKVLGPRTYFLTEESQLRSGCSF